MSEEEKLVIKLLKDSQNTYIEGNKVTQVVLTTEEAKILLNLIENKQNEKEPTVNIQVVYGGRSYGKTLKAKEFITKEYISKDKIREKIEFYKRYGKIKNSEEYVMSVEINVLEELLEED